MADDVDFKSVRKNTASQADTFAMERKLGPKDNAAPVPPTTIESMRTYGDTGLQRSGGFVNDDIDSSMNSVNKRTQTFKKMKTDSTVFGALLAYTSMFRDTKYSVKAAGETPEAITAMEDVKYYLEHMKTDFRDMMSEIATMFTYGYAAMEVTYARGDTKKHKGRIVPDQVNLRAQDTIYSWFFTEEGVPVGFEQQPMNASGTRIVPLDKCIYVRTTNNRENPLGESVLRGAVTDWFYKHRIAEIEGIGIERDLAGLPVMRVPSLLMSSADPVHTSVFASYKQMVKDIRRDEKEGLVLPSDRDDKGNLFYELELLNSKGSRNFDTTAIIKRYDVGIAISMLADFILLGHNRVGSFSLSATKTELFVVALSSFLGVAQQQIQRRLIDDVWRYNGLPDRTKPTFLFAPIEMPDLQVLGEYLKDMSDAGVSLFPDEELENELRTRAGLPLAPEDRVLDPVTGQMVTVEQMETLSTFREEEREQGMLDEQRRADMQPDPLGDTPGTTTSNSEPAAAPKAARRRGHDNARNILSALDAMMSEINELKKSSEIIKQARRDLSPEEIEAMVAQTRKDNAEAKKLELENAAYSNEGSEK